MKTSSWLLNNRREQRQLLVEDKLSFQGAESELSIYDTYRTASKVVLHADQLLYCGMVSGRKVMHADFTNDDRFENVTFLPNESYVMSPGQHVEIDFPEANEQQPTTCLTIEISKEKVESISTRMADLTTLDGLDHQWQHATDVLHVHHSSATQQLLEKLVTLFTQNDEDNDIIIDLGVSELITRLLRQQGRDLLLSYSQSQPDASGMTALLDYIEKHICQPLDIDQFCRIACMSRSKLYNEFKKQLGCGPSEYLQQTRLKKAGQLLRVGKSISEVCFEVGFNDLSHFSRRFSAFYQSSPSQYKTKYWQPNS